MKTGLSKREMFLLFIAAAALLIYLAFQYGISPLYRIYSENVEKQDTLSLEKAMLELKLEAEPVTRMSHEEAEAGFREIERQYPSVMPNDEIDRILTGLCLKNDLSPAALKISDAVDFFAVAEQPAQDGESAAETPAEDKKPAAFVTVEATMLLFGDYASLKKLVDEVGKTDYIRLSRCSYQYEKEDETARMPNISVTFEIIMRKEMPEDESEQTEAA